MCDECASRSAPKPPRPLRCFGCARPMKFVRRTLRFGGLPDLINGMQPALLAAMARMSRDQGRTPVQWDASPGAGFTTGTPWLAINPDYPTVNAAAQVGDPGSVFEHYRLLIALRHEDPVVTDGDFELLLPDHPAIWAFLRRTGEADLLVAANFSADVVDADLPLAPSQAGDWADASVALTSLDGDAPLEPPPGLKLRPWESVVWRRTRG